ncbi:MAG TPA: hypothetical protein VMU21_09105 [Thermodesulfovibrionales bacterium]|nr:hypothetical protein [Thermodesulfovibrionales bacterium]
MKKKRARLMTAMRRAILPISTKRIPDNASNPAIGTKEALCKDFLPWRKSNPTVKRIMMAIIPGNNFIP